MKHQVDFIKLNHGLYTSAVVGLFSLYFFTILNHISLILGLLIRSVVDNFPGLIIDILMYLKEGVSVSKLHLCIENSLL